MVKQEVKTETRTSVQQRRGVVGTVVSDKMTKTVVVRVDRRVKDGRYFKYVTRSKKYKAHDEQESAKPGDLVSLVESRPLSKSKRWVLREILRKGNRPEVLSQ